MSAPAPVAIEGELVIQTAAEHRASLLAALEDTDVLEIDLSAVTELDTAGLQVLLLLLREAAAGGKQVSVLRPSAAVLDVLDIIQLDADLRPRTPGAPHPGDVVDQAVGR